MQFKTRIACYGNRDIALDVAREMIIEAGFEARSGEKDDIQVFVNPHPWNLAAQSPMKMADRVSVRQAPDSLVLEGSLDGVPRRSMVLAYAVGFVGLLLVMANYMWSVHMQPLYKVLLPIAPWPALIPLIHKNMAWLAKRQWNQTLRTVGRDAALRAAEETKVEDEASAPPPETDEAPEAAAEVEQDEPVLV